MHVDVAAVDDIQLGKLTTFKSFQWLSAGIQPDRVQCCQWVSSASPEAYGRLAFADDRTIDPPFEATNPD
jgi:hypothetical protein